MAHQQVAGAAQPGAAVAGPQLSGLRRAERQSAAGAGALLWRELGGGEGAGRGGGHC